VGWEVEHREKEGETMLGGLLGGGERRQGFGIRRSQQLGAKRSITPEKYSQKPEEESFGQKRGVKPKGRGEGGRNEPIWLEREKKKTQ